jgi:hypothetical protein
MRYPSELLFQAGSLSGWLRLLFWWLLLFWLRLEFWLR